MNIGKFQQDFSGFRFDFKELHWDFIGFQGISVQCPWLSVEH